MTIVWPNGSATARPAISSSFGARPAPVPGASSFHRGCDFVGFSRNRAIAAGRVVVAGTPNGWSGGGLQVWIQHDGFFTRQMHFAALNVRYGDWVEAGADLGQQGRTGNVSGVHDHLEVTYGNLHYSNIGQVDPVAFISSRLGSPASGGSSTEEDPFMALNDTQQRQMYEALVNGGQSASAYYKTDAAINIMRTELAPAIASIAAGGILYPGQPYLMANAIVNAVRAEQDKNVDVDEDRLASELARTLAPLITNNLASLSDDDLRRIAKATADESDERARKRLEA